MNDEGNLPPEIEDLFKRYEEEIKKITGHIYYFLLTNDVEIIARVKEVLATGFILWNPARLTTLTLQSEEDPTKTSTKVFLNRLLPYTNQEEFPFMATNILSYGPATPGLVTWYETMFKPLEDEKKKQIDAANKETIEETKSNEQLMENLEKEGKLVHFQKPPNKTLN